MKHVRNAVSLFQFASAFVNNVVIIRVSVFVILVRPIVLIVITQVAMDLVNQGTEEVVETMGMAIMESQVGFHLAIIKF